MYMAMELSNGYWKLLLGDGVRRCQLSIAAGELLRLNEALLKARERFGLPARASGVLIGGGPGRFLAASAKSGHHNAVQTDGT